MSNEMVERVAKVLCRDRIEINAGIERRALTPEFINKAVEAGYSNFIREAKAAIEAMREPTEEMLLSDPDYSQIRSIRTWQGMIDAALKE